MTKHKNKRDRLKVARNVGSNLAGTHGDVAHLRQFRQRKMMEFRHLG